MTFLRPPAQVDESNSLERDRVGVEVCLPEGASQDALRAAAAAAKDRILDQWIAEPGNEAYAQARAEGALDVVFDPATPCVPVTDAPKYPKTYKACVGKGDAGGETGTSEQPLASWLLRSRASIDPSASRITLRARGATTSAPIRGRVSFRITPESAAEIGELTLFTDPLEAAGLSAEELSLGQARALSALCTEASPPGASRLCGDYSIPAGGAAVQVAGKLDGQSAFVQLVNAQPVGVYVDLDARSFTMAGGPLLGSLPVDGGSEIVELWLTITGRFENLAPVASTKETPLRFECIDQGIATVHLDASASFDQDPGPGIVGYRWTEDAGLPTQRLLGTAKSVDVPMGFGGHSVTLVVTDAQGALGSETVRVEVFDPRLDSHQAPPDVFALRQDRRGAVVEIGEASASDGCSGAVLITNDAPAGLRFPPGASTVQWTFDDYHGNVVQDSQKVFVVGARHHPPPIASSYALRNTLADGTVDVVYVYGTQGQGKEATADEHVLVRSPSGRVFTADASGRLREAGRVRRSAGSSFGKRPTQGFLRLRAFAGALSEEGRYEFAYVLTVPDGSPEEPSDVLARDEVPLELRRR